MVGVKVDQFVTLYVAKLRQALADRGARRKVTYLIPTLTLILNR